MRIGIVGKTLASKSSEYGTQEENESSNKISVNKLTRIPTTEIELHLFATSHFMESKYTSKIRLK